MLVFFVCIIFSPPIFEIVNGDRTCDQNLIDDEIIPTYTDYGTSGDLKVIYAGNSDVDCGEGFSITKINTPPTVLYDVQGKCEYTAIIFFDPDTSVPIEEFRIFLHWFVINIPSDVLKEGYSSQADTGDVIAEYFPPGALGVETHRYTFFAYCQQHYIEEADYLNDKLLRRIHPRSLAEQYDLGSALSCNFFYLVVETDSGEVPAADEVPDENEKLGNRDKTL
nr:venom protein [Lampona murina]